ARPGAAPWLAAGRRRQGRAGLDRHRRFFQAGNLVRRGPAHAGAAGRTGQAGARPRRTAPGLATGGALAPRFVPRLGAAPEGTMLGAGGMARQGILSLAIKDKGALYNAYMPFVRGGGIFVPTAKRYSLGDEVFILLTLMDDKERLPVA